MLYLTNGKTETHYPMEHWKEVLNKKILRTTSLQLHSKPTYVEEVTKDFVTLRCGEKEYKVYTSMRKIGAFKKAVLEFGE